MRRVLGSAEEVETNDEKIRLGYCNMIKFNRIWKQNIHFWYTFLLKLKNQCSGMEGSRVQWLYEWVIHLCDQISLAGTSLPPVTYISRLLNGHIKPVIGPSWWRNQEQQYRSDEDWCLYQEHEINGNYFIKWTADSLTDCTYLQLNWTWILQSPRRERGGTRVISAYPK